MRLRLICTAVVIALAGWLLASNHSGTSTPASAPHTSSPVVQSSFSRADTPSESPGEQFQSTGVAGPSSEPSPVGAPSVPLNSAAIKRFVVAFNRVYYTVLLGDQAAAKARALAPMYANECTTCDDPVPPAGSNADLARRRNKLTTIAAALDPHDIKLHIFGGVTVSASTVAETVTTSNLGQPGQRAISHRSIPYTLQLVHSAQGWTIVSLTH